MHYDVSIGTESTALLVFGLSGECFGLPVTSIHEVIDPLPITMVPNAPKSSPGLINVRGIVTPVIDIELRLQISPSEHRSNNRRMIVLELPVEGTSTRVAITADEVYGVFETDLSQTTSIPPLGARWPEAYVVGLVKRDADMVVLLNPDALFSPETNYMLS